MEKEQVVRRDYVVARWLALERNGPKGSSYKTNTTTRTSELVWVDEAAMEKHFDIQRTAFAQGSRTLDRGQGDGRRKEEDG